MTSISLFGAEIDLEFEGTFLNAASRSNVGALKNTNLVRTTGGPDEACAIGWTFESSGGRRGVYCAYASEHSLPCELVLNGGVAFHRALMEPTGAFHPRAVDWRYQGTVELRPGTNEVLIRRGGAIPLIGAIGFGPPPPVEQADINAYARQADAEARAVEQGAPFSLSPHKLGGLVAEVQKLSLDPAAAASFRSMLPHIVDAAIEDARNGQMRITFGGPLNGQRFRQRIFDRLVRLGVDAIIETGAYRGTSTAFFARRGLPVYSCELKEAYFAAAAVQNAACPNVSLYLQDSRSFLRSLAANRSLAIEFPFIYLDAHWNNDLPLADEIAIITGRWERYAIMVDDFHVPKTEYSFDRYQNGIELTLDYLQRNQIQLDRMAVLFPSATPDAETGKRRGTLILTPETIYAEQLKNERLLYRHRIVG